MNITFDLRKAFGIAGGYLLASFFLSEYYPLIKASLFEGHDLLMSDYLGQAYRANWIKLVSRAVFIGIGVGLLTAKNKKEIN